MWQDLGRIHKSCYTISSQYSPSFAWGRGEILSNLSGDRCISMSIPDLIHSLDSPSFYSKVYIQILYKLSEEVDRDLQDSESSLLEQVRPGAIG